MGGATTPDTRPGRSGYQLRLTASHLVISRLNVLKPTATPHLQRTFCLLMGGEKFAP
jgi:hypothetical protein